MSNTIKILKDAIAIVEKHKEEFEKFDVTALGAGEITGIRVTLKNTEKTWEYLKENIADFKKVDDDDAELFYIEKKINDVVISHLIFKSEYEELLEEY